MNSSSADSRRVVLIAAQRWQQIVAYDVVNRIVLKTWSPIADGGRDGWGAPSDVRPAAVGELSCIVCCDSNGYVGVVSSEEEVLWDLRLPKAANLHAAELLPDGRIAVTGSLCHWVRIYPGLQRPDDKTPLAEHPLRDGHGVLWDPTENCLWALGGRELVKLAVEDRQLRKVVSYLLPVPGGHDLRPVLSSPGRLWVSSQHGNVYQFEISSGAWEIHATDDEPSGTIRSTVTSIGDNRDGQIVFTRVKHSGWMTDDLEFRNPAGLITLGGSGIYKARWA